ncbi:MAG: amidohydrolase family protein [Gammaproteobacteria bacterium]|nr:amidohydrolase family protein [Gammaproteobacteria bacterium]
MFLEATAIERYLAISREVGSRSVLLDCHVHPTEIIRNRLRYHAVEPEPQLYASGEGCYCAPAPGRLRLAADPATVDRATSALKNRMSELLFTRNFRFIGARVLADQMALAGIGRACLLPVPSEVATLPEQMVLLEALHRADARFLPGYGLPAVRSGAASLLDELRTMVARFGVRVLKIHPNISGIDIGSEPGRAYLEEALAACGTLGLPVIVHGGISPILGESGRARYARLENLTSIDWGRGSAPVILAHFGLYGCGAADITDADVHGVKTLLDRHDNLFTDSSGVGFPVIEKMMRNLPVDKILFGSDALYLPVWEAMAYVACAAERMGRDPAATIEQIAGTNARTHLPGLLL